MPGRLITLAEAAERREGVVRSVVVAAAQPLPSPPSGCIFSPTDKS